MDASEIEIYTTKLGEVELALSADPTNTELAQLKQEIEDLLALGNQLYEPPATPDRAPAAPSAPAQAQSGNPDKEDAGRPRNAKGAGGVQRGKVDKQQHHRKKNNGKRVSPDALASSSQQAWLKFAKGSSSKKLKAKAINSQSIFRSPDTVSGRVGVSNSGKGMTKTPPSTRKPV
ncbi:hypothetical protein H4S06_003667 [Coemansia sp. BCRC 34490]|nr:hypothetical protein LPJ72_002560 [Coemansia sp. Benny D160-2]KAJ2753899.1 hypothetical protein H4S06_003667 [Coemansia sp. BCRC 34490]